MEFNWLFNKYRNKFNSIFIYIYNILYLWVYILKKVYLYIILILLIFDIYDMVLVWGVLNFRGFNFCGRM